MRTGEQENALQCEFTRGSDAGHANVAYRAHHLRMHDPAIIEALWRIESEFVAMPGLKLTAAQVNRLCGLPKDVCESALQALTRAGFLQISGDAFLRLGRRYPHPGVVA
jgi:hypothetical protein